MADEKANTWILYYWPKLAGRAEFVRVLFEEAGVKFQEINDLEVLVPMFRQGKVRKNFYMSIEHRMKHFG